MNHALGFLAATLTVGSGFPQVFRILRTRDVHAISLPLYVMLFAGVLLWLAYGITIHAWPVVVANAISSATSGLILFLKIRLSKLGDNPRDADQWSRTRSQNRSRRIGI